jgi:protein-L-isoaspartate(D-aspartate) O-methyltransferase
MSANPALRHMIDSQLLTNEVTEERLLSAIAATPREAFLPPQFRGVAYADNQIPLGHGRKLLAPLVLALLLQRAALQPQDKVLHLAPAFGYATAVMATMVAQVIAVESQHEFLEAMRENLQRERVGAEVFNACLTVGYPLAAPYSVIVIEGAVQHLPGSLTDQLAEGGRIVAVKNIQQRLDAAEGLGRIMLGVKHQGVLRFTHHEDVSAPLLPGYENKTAFTF